MIKKPEEMRVAVNKEMRGGKGEVTVRHLLNAPEELCGKGRLFAQTTIPPGASIGRHPHNNEFETFYVVQGSGEYYDDGATLAFSAGDVLQTREGGAHSVVNTGSEDVVLVALILFA